MSVVVSSSFKLEVNDGGLRFVGEDARDVARLVATELERLRLNAPFADAPPPTVLPLRRFRLRPDALLEMI